MMRALPALRLSKRARFLPACTPPPQGHQVQQCVVDGHGGGEAGGRGTGQVGAARHLEPPALPSSSLLSACPPAVLCRAPLSPCPGRPFVSSPSCLLPLAPACRLQTGTFLSDVSMAWPACAPCLACAMLQCELHHCGVRAALARRAHPVPAPLPIPAAQLPLTGTFAWVAPEILMVGAAALVVAWDNWGCCRTACLWLAHRPQPPPQVSNPARSPVCLPACPHCLPVCLPARLPGWLAGCLPG